MEIYEDTAVIELEAQVRRLERRLDFLTDYADEQLMADYRAFVVAEEAAQAARRGELITRLPAATRCTASRPVWWPWDSAGCTQSISPFGQAPRRRLCRR